MLVTNKLLVHHIVEFCCDASQRIVQLETTLSKLKKFSNTISFTIIIE